MKDPLSFNVIKKMKKKLQLGINYAISKGVIDSNFIPEPYITLDVIGKSPNDVTNEILNYIHNDKKKNSDDNSGDGGGLVIVIVGLSGTGKGTTVTKLREKLSSSSSNTQVICWSNGNIFRTVTLLASTWCEQNCKDGLFHEDEVLTKENLELFMNMLEFGKFDGKYDIRINGLGFHNTLISSIQNTLLKDSNKVGKYIPTVAQVTQGEVILFASKAIHTMTTSTSTSEEKIVVLLEGREQTVNYVRTKYRFNLILSDMSLIGKRRAAQRLMAATLLDIENNKKKEKNKEKDDDDEDDTTTEEEEEEIMNVLMKQLDIMVSEIK